MSDKLGLLKTRLEKSLNYGYYCDHLEEAILEIIRAGDTSEEGVRILAFTLMEAPADLDYRSGEFPFRNARDFLSQQSLEIKALFRKECKKLPRGRDDRIDSFL